MPGSTPITAIHQFHAGTAFGDAITQGMLFTRDLLREMGFESQIYALHIPPELVDEIIPFKKWMTTDHCALLLHHSFYNEQENWVLALTCPVWMVYHNITPAEFFPENSPLWLGIKKGLQQLETFKPKIAATIADSNFNKEDLYAAGYHDVDVIPLLFDLDAIQQHPWDEYIAQKEAEIPTLLFVGRIVSNKKQLELIRIIDWLRALVGYPFQLVLVGGMQPKDPYYLLLQDEIKKRGLEAYVRFTGKISYEKLYAWYHAASVFVCMSEHEGFGVPLIEAMAFDVPVIALESSNISHTLGEGGLLVKDTHPSAVASLIKILLQNRPLQRQIIENQRRHIAQFSRQKIREKLIAFLEKQQVTIPKRAAPVTQKVAAIAYQIEGPFESSYSLALVNRELAQALEKQSPGQVSIFATDGHRDYLPDLKKLARLPAVVKTLWQRGQKRSRAEVVIRDLYPPRVADMDGLINLLYFFWEESQFSPLWAWHFNRKIDGMLAPSEYGAKIMQDNGVSVPITLIRTGVDHIDEVLPEATHFDLGEGFKFLHISSGFARKGVDILLSAFVAAFTDKDPVTLVIKTHPHPLNDVKKQIEKIQAAQPTCPRIIFINEDFSAAQIKDLYLKCDAFVSATRGEGFGLPMAEAMWLDKPVITTAYGGQSDFCTEETAWLIDFDFAFAQTHFGQQDSVWVEPKVASLMQQLHTVFHSDSATRKVKAQAAQALLKAHFTWEKCAHAVKAAQYQAQQYPLLQTRKKCAWYFLGENQIAAQWSKQMLAHADPFNIAATLFLSPNVADNDGTEVSKENAPDVMVLHIVLTEGVSHLEKMQTKLQKSLVPVVLIVEALSKENAVLFATWFQKATRLIVFRLEDLNTLKSIGCIKNTTLWWPQKSELASSARRLWGMLSGLSC